MIPRSESFENDFQQWIILKRSKGHPRSDKAFEMTRFSLFPTECLFFFGLLSLIYQISRPSILSPVFINECFSKWSRSGDNSGVFSQVSKNKGNPGQAVQKKDWKSFKKKGLSILTIQEGLTSWTTNKKYYGKKIHMFVLTLQRSNWLIYFYIFTFIQSLWRHSIDFGQRSTVCFLCIALASPPRHGWSLIFSRKSIRIFARNKFWIGEHFEFGLFQFFSALIVGDFCFTVRTWTFVFLRRWFALCGATLIDLRNYFPSFRVQKVFSWGVNTSDFPRFPEITPVHNWFQSHRKGIVQGRIFF